MVGSTAEQHEGLKWHSEDGPSSSNTYQLGENWEVRCRCPPGIRLNGLGLLILPEAPSATQRLLAVKSKHQMCTEAWLGAKVKMLNQNKSRK